MIDLRLPNITAQGEKEQLLQIKSYLYQLTEQLQWALNNMDSSSSNVVTVAPQSASGQKSEPIDTQATFAALKPLIIKSAEIVAAYSEEITTRLSGEYVAQSDFGTFRETTVKETTETSKGVETLYTNIQEIITDIEGLNYAIVEVTANTNSGLLYYDENGIPVYGFEVGQRNVVDGVEVFNKYARFISNRLSFYDRNDVEVAYISDYKLYITHVEITGSATLGAFVLDTTKGIRLKWVGRG